MIQILILIIVAIICLKKVLEVEDLKEELKIKTTENLNLKKLWQMQV